MTRVALPPRSTLSHPEHRGPLSLSCLIWSWGQPSLLCWRVGPESPRKVCGGAVNLLTGYQGRGYVRRGLRGPALSQTARARFHGEQRQTGQSLRGGVHSGVPGSYSENTDGFPPRISCTLLAPLLFESLSQPVLCLEKGIGQCRAEQREKGLPCLTDFRSQRP